MDKFFYTVTLQVGTLFLWVARPNITIWNVPVSNNNINAHRCRMSNELSNPKSIRLKKVFSMERLMVNTGETFLIINE